MKLIGHCEGAPVYAAEHIIMLRDGAAGIDQAIAKAVRGAKRSGQSPIVILTPEQLAAHASELAFEQARHDAESKKARERGRQEPAPIAAPALSPAPAEAPALAEAPAAEPAKRSRKKAEPAEAPAAEPAPASE